MDYTPKMAVFIPKKSYSKYEKAVNLKIFGEKNNFQVPYLIISNHHNIVVYPHEKSPFPKPFLMKSARYDENGAAFIHKKSVRLTSPPWRRDAVMWPWGYNLYQSNNKVLIWLVVWNMTFMTFHILGIIIPTDFHIFQRGSNHQPVIYLIISY